MRGWERKINNSINRNIVECKVLYIFPVLLFLFRINRNIVECKVPVSGFPFQLLLRINRNIVECKDHRSNQFRIRYGCINRNIVECKETVVSVRMDQCPVLIETLWNVKTCLERL